MSCEMRVNACSGYPQVVSAALVSVRSSGSLVAVSALVLSSCMVTDEPLGAGEVTAWKSGPRTTWTTSRSPVTRSTLASRNADATVAAACSLPGEKNTVVAVSELG